MHILKDFISIDDLETRWGLDKKQIESFIYERGDEPRLTMWYATEKRARPDGGQSAFVKRAQYLNGCVFDMADVLKIEELNPELVHVAMAENDEPKMIDGKFVFAEHQIIGKDVLYKRWFGATHEEIARHFDRGELRAYEHYKGPINNVIWCDPGQIYYQSRHDYSNPGLYEYRDDQCSFFLLEDVLKCEKLHPEYIGNVSAESLGLPDDPLKDVPFTKSSPESSGAPLPPVDKTDWRDCNVIQDFESLPKISNSLCRNNIVLAIDADGSTCPPHLATFPLKIFFTEMPKPDEGEYYTSADLMERYKLSPTEFVNYLATHEDLYPYGVPDYHFSSNYVMSKKIEALGRASFHYRNIQNHEKSMQENGYYDKDYNARQRRTIQNEVNPSDDTPRVAELEAQLAQAQTIIAELKANLPQKIDFSGELRQGSPDHIVAITSMDAEMAKDYIAEKDARIAELEANLSEIQTQEAHTEAESPTKIEQGKGDGTWEDSVTAVCKAIFYVLKEGRRDWVSGKEPGTGETDSVGKETFRALLKRLHPNARRCLVKAESAAWKVLSDNGYTHLGGRKPNP